VSHRSEIETTIRDPSHGIPPVSHRPLYGTTGAFVAGRGSSDGFLVVCCSKNNRRTRGDVKEFPVAAYKPFCRTRVLDDELKFVSSEDCFGAGNVRLSPREATSIR